MRETRVQSLGREDLLEKEMATHCRILAWKIPWMEEPGRLQSTLYFKVINNLSSYGNQLLCAVCSVVSYSVWPRGWQSTRLHYHEILQAKKWIRLPSPTPRGTPDPGIKPASLMSPALAGKFFTTVQLGKPNQLLLLLLLLLILWTYRFKIFNSNHCSSYFNGCLNGPMFGYRELNAMTHYFDGFKQSICICIYLYVHPFWCFFIPFWISIVSSGTISLLSIELPFAVPM